VYWQEDDARESGLPPGEVTDLAFAVECRELPVDHAWALAEAVLILLPWMREDPRAGVHPIHVAASGNGWMRPQAPGDLLQLSRRTRLVLRVPAARVADAARLSGQRLDVAGHALSVGASSERPLNGHETLFSRYVAGFPAHDEEAFLAAAARELAAAGVRVRKMLGGIAQDVRTPGGTVPTRSLMIADLSPEDSRRLQERGLGAHRQMGCGMFVPHKGVREVSSLASG